MAFRQQHAGLVSAEAIILMAKIVVLGAGVMGSALAAVAAKNNDVLLVGSPLDDHIVDAIQNQQPHPGLRLALPQNINTVHQVNLDKASMPHTDVVVIGVSSPGVDWALNTITRNAMQPNILALVTKGLVTNQGSELAPRTYAQTIPSQLTEPKGRVVGIGGPCIARELAMKYPTRVCFAAQDMSAANDLRSMLSTPYYHIKTHHDFTGLEACAALKNFICIGVSAMLSAHKLDDGHAKNPVAALFNQGVYEIAVLNQWIKTSVAENTVTDSVNQSPDIAYDLAGLGDLHVTVGGGRNSRLGQFLGTGRLLSDVLDTDMRGVTVEGVDTGKQLLAGFKVACKSGALNASELPLTCAILDVIEKGLPFSLDFDRLPT